MPSLNNGTNHEHVTFLLKSNFQHLLALLLAPCLLCVNVSQPTIYMVSMYIVEANL